MTTAIYILGVTVAILAMIFAQKLGISSEFNTKVEFQKKNYTPKKEIKRNKKND
jgi:hypothetical protein